MISHVRIDVFVFEHDNRFVIRKEFLVFEVVE